MRMNYSQSFTVCVTVPQKWLDFANMWPRRLTLKDVYYWSVLLSKFMAVLRVYAVVGQFNSKLLHTSFCPSYQKQDCLSLVLFKIISIVVTSRLCYACWNQQANPATGNCKYSICSPHFTNEKRPVKQHLRVALAVTAECCIAIDNVVKLIQLSKVDFTHWVCVWTL